MKKSTHFLSEEEQMRTGFERLFRRIRDHILITFVLLFTCSHWNSARATGAVGTKRERKIKTMSKIVYEYEEKKD